MEEKKARKAREKREQEEWERRKDAEAGRYDYMGAGQRGGGGTPFKDAHGEVKASLRDVLPGSGDAAPASASASAAASASPSAARDTARDRLFGGDGGRSSRLPAVRGPVSPGRSPPSPTASNGPWSDSRGGGGPRWTDDRPTPRSSRGGSVTSAADTEVLDLYRANNRLKSEVSALESKLEQALSLLEEYRERYGPLPA